MAGVLSDSPDKLRVVLITQWFEPEPAFKGLLFARELAQRGFDVEVVTGFPNYPSGKLYPGYRLRPLQREQRDGILVTRVALYPSHDSSALRRILNYASFAISLTIYGLFLMRRREVIYAYHPPLTVGVAVSIIRLIRRIPVVYDIQDLWPDTLAATGMLRNPRILRLVEFVCGLVYRSVDRIAVLSPGFRRSLISRQVPAEKISVIYNWADETALACRETAGGEWSPSHVFRVIFAGNMGRAQALDAVLEAASILRGSTRPIRFTFIGGGIEVPRLKALAVERALDNVEFLAPVPMTEIGSILASADALLVHLAPDPLFSITIPSKTQAYLCVGRPVIMAVEGDAAELVTRSGGGVTAKPGDAQSIAAAVRALAERRPEDLAAMGERGRAFYREHLAIERGADQFAALLRAAASTARDPS